MDDLKNLKPSRRNFIAGAGTTVAAATLFGAAGANASTGAPQSPASSTSAPTMPVQPDAMGTGGETHQLAGGPHANLTTQQGLVIADDENSLKIGPPRASSPRRLHPA